MNFSKAFDHMRPSLSAEALEASGWPTKLTNLIVKVWFRQGRLSRTTATLTKTVSNQRWPIPREDLWDQKCASCMAAAGTSSAETRTNGDGEARPPEFAKYSATTGDGEARPPEFAKYSAKTGDGEARPPEFAKYSTTTGDSEARPPEVAKYTATTGDGEVRLPEFAKHSATTGDDEAQPSELAKYGAVHCRRHSSRKD